MPAKTNRQAQNGEVELAARPLGAASLSLKLGAGNAASVGSSRTAVGCTPSLVHVSLSHGVPWAAHHATMRGREKEGKNLG